MRPKSSTPAARAGRAVTQILPAARARRRRRRTRAIWLAAALTGAVAAGLAVLRARSGTRPTWEVPPTGVPADGTRGGS